MELCYCEITSFCSLYTNTCVQTLSGDCGVWCMAFRLWIRIFAWCTECIHCKGLRFSSVVELFLLETRNSPVFKRKFVEIMEISPKLGKIGNWILKFWLLSESLKITFKRLIFFYFHAIFAYSPSQYDLRSIK